jgi:signal transduction histidine kinase
VTLTVHQAGSVETTIAFLYLFHIVLSCIFLPRIESFAVTLIACALYAVCLGLETGGFLPPSTLYENDALRVSMNAMPGFPLIHIGSVEVTFLVVWFLTSRLSILLRTREKDLMETNQRLLSAQTERMRFMLQTTHELKAPFAAIQANTQLLLKGYCGALNQDALEIVQRIHERSHRLAGMIQEMLQWANLRSQSEGPLRRVPVSVASALLSSIEQVRPIAEEHRVTLREELQQADSLGIEDHLKVLFINLLKNAIQYSRKGGEVRVRCTIPPGSNEPQVVIEDHGIGIAPGKIPRIFDEYYRTNEAIAHNKDSTGLGLAIVRHIAETHRIRLRVESAPGEGTVFTLRFPALPGG